MEFVNIVWTQIVGATEEVEDEEIIEQDESGNTMTLSGHFLQMPDGTLVKAEQDTEIDFEDNIIYRYICGFVFASITNVPECDSKK